MIFVIVLIVAQSTLLIGTMIVAGEVSEAEQTAFQSLHEKVDVNKKSISNVK
ncbi:hypothetical protein KHA80_22955 [Anaerobacillus sp. HL2]|nr:hypothetical protein KHA80_22955 [Anaerobacillus sp. HL2]